MGWKPGRERAEIISSSITPRFSLWRRRVNYKLIMNGFNGLFLAPGLWRALLFVSQSHHVTITSSLIHSAQLRSLIVRLFLSRYRQTGDDASQQQQHEPETSELGANY
jgi:hypothetical protein